MESYLNQDKDVVNSVNIRSINWKGDLREKAIRCVIEDDHETEKQAEVNNDLNVEQPELKIWSSQAVSSIVDDLNSFCKTAFAKCIEFHHMTA